MEVNFSMDNGVDNELYLVSYGLPGKLYHQVPKSPRLVYLF